MSKINYRLARVFFDAGLPRATILILVCLTVLSSPPLRAQPAQKSAPAPAARRPLPKLSNGARGFDTSQKDSTARLIAIGGGYGAGENEEPLPKLKAKTAEGYYRWGVELYGADHNQAIAAFEKAIKLNPNMVKAYWKLGNAYSEYNNLVDESKYDDEECYRRAIAAFQQVARLQPGRGGAYNNLGILYFDTSQYEKSLAAFQTGLRLKPKGGRNEVSLVEAEVLDDREIYIFIGDAYERLNQNELALRSYLRAKKMRVDLELYLANIDERLGLVYEKLGDLDKAIAAYEAIKVDAVDENDRDLRLNLTPRLGLLYESKGNHQRAIEYFTLAISYYEIEVENGKKDPPPDDGSELSKEWKQEGQRIKTGLAAWAYNLGVVYLLTNQMARAVDAFRKAVEMDPNHASAHFNLGYVYLTLGDKTAAAKELKALQSLDLDLSRELEGLINRPGQ